MSVESHLARAHLRRSHGMCSISNDERVTSHWARKDVADARIVTAHIIRTSGKCLPSGIGLSFVELFDYVLDGCRRIPVVVLFLVLPRVVKHCQIHRLVVTTRVACPHHSASKFVQTKKPEGWFSDMGRVSGLSNSRSIGISVLYTDLPFLRTRISVPGMLFTKLLCCGKVSQL